MTASKTATVETLTAEVRVLMVGSRQITLSVYGQLDRIDAGEIEPFGRVRPKDGTPGWIYIIGKNPGNGELVRACVPFTDDAIASVLGYASGDRPWTDDAREARIKLKLADERDMKAESFNPEMHLEKARQHREEAAGHARRADALRAEYAAEAQPYVKSAERLAALPLIVLAGLR
jgi:hypothetical protein